MTGTLGCGFEVIPTEEAMRSTRPARPRGRLSALSISHSKSVLCGGLLWTCGRLHVTALSDGFVVRAVAHVDRVLAEGQLSENFNPHNKTEFGCVFYNAVRPSGSVASSLCSTVHPLHTRSSKIYGTSIYETSMQPSSIRGPACSCLASKTPLPANHHHLCFRTHRNPTDPAK